MWFKERVWEKKIGEKKKSLFYQQEFTDSY